MTELLSTLHGHAFLLGITNRFLSTLRVVFKAADAARRRTRAEPARATTAPQARLLLPGDQKEGTVARSATATFGGRRLRFSLFACAGYY